MNKKILGFMIAVFLMMMPCIALAATSGNLTISASKSSGQVTTAEKIKYTCTTDSTDAGVSQFSAVITDVATGKTLANYSSTSKNELGSLSYSLSIGMPGVPYANIKVLVTYKDILGKSASKDYYYTMDATQKFDVVASPSSGKIATGQKIELTSTATLTGVGLKKITYAMYDENNAKIVSKAATPDDKGTGVGVAKAIWNIDTPSNAYSKVRLVVTLEDIRGDKYNEVFNYTMDVPTTTLTMGLYDEETNSKISDGTKLSPNDGVYVKTTSSNTSVGIKTTNIKMYNSSNTLIYDKTSTSTAEAGTTLYAVKFTVPSNAGTYKLVATSTTLNGISKTYTMNFTIDENKEVDMTNTITISSDQSNNATLPLNTNVSIKAKSSNNSVGIRLITIDVYNNSNNEYITTKIFETSNDEVGTNPAIKVLTLNKAMKYKLVVRATDIIGNEKEATYCYTVLSDGEKSEENTIDIRANYPTGSTLKVGTQIKFSAYSSNEYIGIKNIKLALYDNITGEYLKTYNTNSDQEKGAQPLNCVATFSTAFNYKIVVTGTDINGNTESETFIYKIVSDEVEEDENAELTITFNPSSGKEVEAGDDIEIVAKTSVSSDKVVKVSYKMYNEDEEKIASDSESSSGKTSLSIKAEVPDDLDDGDKITVEVTAKLVSGIEKTSKAKYTIVEEDDDNDDDDVYDDSVINSEGDDLAVDLWLVEDERFYELDEEIEFVAYYYNFESKDKEDVVLEIEIPEGFTIKNVIADRGTIKKKNGEYIKVTIGTVESKELEEVRFTLVADDDDLSEEISEIVATIYSDKDEEEDMSTQRIYIYEEGEDGSHKAFITGYTDGTFRPDNNITREEVAAMVARAFGHTATYSSRTFTDVKQTSWSYKYIAGCTNKGIITGYTDGSFKPYNNITRAELYAMIYRAMDLSLDNEKALLVPKEYKKDSSWETGYIAGLARLRMLEEMDETDADEYATRAEVVYLISRVQFRNPSKAYASYYSDVNSSYWCAKDIAAASIDYTFERKSGGKEDIDD